MGCRVHVVKKEREYGNTAAFNWNYTEFYSMLNSMGCDACSGGIEESNFAEMQVTEYRAALNILESLRDGKEIDDADLTALNIESAEVFNADIKDDVMQYIKKIGYELKDLCEVMEQFYEQRDQNSEWIQFEAW